MPEFSTAPDTDTLLRQESVEIFEFHDQYVIAQVQFGQAALKCRGSGICRVDLYINDRVEWARSKCHRAIAKLAYSDSSLVLMFDRHGLCRSLWDKYFSKGYIGLKEDLYLGYALCQKIKLPPVRIPAGRYPVVRKGLKSYIVFDQASKDYSTNPVKN